MKATLRRSGRRMVTLNVKHHVGALEFVNVLAYLMTHDPDDLGDDVDNNDPDTWPTRIGRDKIAGFTRELYSFKGREASDYWTDHTDDVDEDEVRAWAERIVDRAFPELCR